MSTFTLGRGRHWTVIDTALFSKKKSKIWVSFMAARDGRKAGLSNVLTSSRIYTLAVGSSPRAELVTTRTAWLTARMPRWT
jgi:hypothetical protein